MRSILDLGAKLLSPDDVRQLFPDEQWHEVLALMRDPIPIHFLEGGLTIDALAAGDGPWALIVHGDLHASGDLDFSTSDYKTSLLVVYGSVHARNFTFTNGATCVIKDNLHATGYVFGRYGDESAALYIGGHLRARAVFLDHVTGIEVDEIDAIVCASVGWQLPMDIPSSDPDGEVYVRDVVDDDGELDLYRAAEAAARGAPILRPEAENFYRRTAPWRRRSS